MDKPFDLGDFLRFIFKKLKLPLILALILLIAGLIFGFFKSSKVSYTASIPACINLKNPDTADAAAFTTLVTYIKDSLSSDYFYVKLSNVLLNGLSDSEVQSLFKSKKPAISDIKNAFTVTVRGNLIIFLIESTDYNLGLKAGKILSDFVKNFVSDNVTIADVTLLEPTSYNLSAEKGFTNVSKYGILSAAAGFILGVLFIFIFDVTSDSVKDSEDLLKFDLKILGKLECEGEAHESV